MANYSLFTADQARRTGRAVRAYEAAKQAPGGKTGLRPIGQFVQVVVRNDSGSDLNAGQILGLNGPSTPPSGGDENFAQFRQAVSFSGVTPQSPQHIGRFAVLLFDCAAGDAVPCCVSGVCETMVNVAGAGGPQLYQYCDISGGDSSGLGAIATDLGSAEILWAANDTAPGVRAAGLQWAIVRVGCLLPAHPPTFAVSTSCTSSSPVYTFPGGSDPSGCFTLASGQVQITQPGTYLGILTVRAWANNQHNFALDGIAFMDSDFSLAIALAGGAGNDGFSTGGEFEGGYPGYDVNLSPGFAVNNIQITDSHGDTVALPTLGPAYGLASATHAGTFTIAAGVSSTSPVTLSLTPHFATTPSDVTYSSDVELHLVRLYP